MPLLRSCSPELAAALSGGVELWAADTFTFTLSDGVTKFYWTSWDTDLNVGGQAFSSKDPWLQRSKWNVTNTMEVPTLTVYLRALGSGFNGGAAILQQIHNGLFDGASFLLSKVYMTSPGNTSALGSVDLFGGEVAGIDLNETTANISIKGKVNKLDQYAPRNMYQIGCNHAFCDAGCTLSRNSFTASFVMGASPTATFVPWASAPGTPSLYLGGSVQVTSGAAAGSWRTVLAADSSGLTLSYPLYEAPQAGDTFKAFQGCDKTFDSGSGRSCTDRSNTQNYRGFEFVPPPNSAY